MAETSNPTRAVEVFFSYSHKDEDLRDELSKHLALLKRQHVVTGWHDRKIGAGKEWENEIDKHLNAADIILLLISSDFLASDYCYDVEVQRAMKRHDAGEARVIPIILRPVDWSGAPFSRLQALPKDAKPVTDWPNRDQAFLNVAQGIRAAVEELVASQVTHWFAKLDKAASLGNWPTVINLGERILKLLPDHQPTRSKTAAAYVKRWSHHLGGTSYMPDDVTGLISVRTKRYEDLKQVLAQITADLNQAIHLEPRNAEYHFIRFSLLRNSEWDRSDADYERNKKLALADLEHAIELAPSTAKYYFARACVMALSDDEEGALRDLQHALERGYPENFVRDRETLVKEMARMRRRFKR